MCNADGRIGVSFYLGLRRSEEGANLAGRRAADKQKENFLDALSWPNRGRRKRWPSYLSERV